MCKQIKAKWKNKEQAKELVTSLLKGYSRDNYSNNGFSINLNKLNNAFSVEKMKKDGYELELTYNYDPEKPYDIGDGFSHIAIGAPNIEELREKHLSLGYEVTPLKGLPGEPPKYYFVTDPDGYKVEVIRTEC